MNSSTSASDLAAPRFCALFFAAALGSVVLVVGAAQLAWTHLRLLERISPMHAQLHLVRDAGPAVRLLAIGDSHAALGFRPAPADRGLASAAFPGESVRDIRLKLRYLQPRLPNLAQVLLQAQPHMLYPSRDRPPAPQYLELSARDASFHPLERWWDQFAPCCRARVLPEALHAARGRPPAQFVPAIGAGGFIDYSGHAPYARERFAELAAKEVASYGGTRIVPSLAREYESLIEESLRSRVRVTLVRYPLAESYWQALGEAAMREADAYFSAVASRLGLRTCGSWAPWPDNLHLNPDHLSPEGAARYHADLQACLARG